MTTLLSWRLEHTTTLDPAGDFPVTGKTKKAF
jgi:hypothetical protein